MQKKIKQLLLGFLIIFIGLGLLIYENNYQRNKIRENETRIYNFINNAGPAIIDNNQKQYDYIAVLKIPTINLKRGLVATDNYYNNVDYNLEIIKGSQMPIIMNSNLIIVGHNGNSDISFFRNLSRLKKGDKIYLYYQNQRFQYMLDHFYEDSKNGYANIIRDFSKTTITLITCKRNNPYKQLVFIAYLVNQYDI